MKEKTECYPAWNTSILFSAWHILLTYFNNSMKLIWNYKDNRPLPPSVHSWKNFDNYQRKAQVGNFAMFEIVPRRLVVKWMLILLRNLFNALQGSLRNLCCTFPKSSKQLGCGKKSFCCCSMHAKWSTSKRFWGQIRFQN